MENYIQDELNIKHANNPLVGDMWFERVFNGVLIVIYATDTHVIICDKKVNAQDRWRWDIKLENLKEYTKEDFIKRLKYDTNDHFWCDVRPVNNMKSKYVKDHKLLDTGGGYLVDEITLFNNMTITVTDESIQLNNDEDAFHDGCDPIWCMYFNSSEYYIAKLISDIQRELGKSSIEAEKEIIKLLAESSDVLGAKSKTLLTNFLVNNTSFDGAVSTLIRDLRAIVSQI